MRNHFLICVLGAMAAFLFSTETSAQQPVLTYGTNNEVALLEDTADQRVDFFASNVAGKSFDTFEMFLQVGDGGVAAGGTDPGPRLTAVELGGVGTLFEGGTRGSFPSGSQTPLLWADFIDGVVVENDGLMGTLVFDTTGLDSAINTSLRFTNIVIEGITFNSNFNSSTTTEDLALDSDGIAIVPFSVPEPSSALLIATTFGLLGLRRRR